MFCDFSHTPPLEKNPKFKRKRENGTGPVINRAVPHMFSMHVDCYLSFYSPNPPSSQIYNAVFQKSLLVSIEVNMIVSVHSISITLTVLFL